MTTFIALLRGINVGGHNKLPMADWRALLEKRGASDVRTYIQSGNAVFSATGKAAVHQKNIRDDIEAAHGFAPDVWVRPFKTYCDITAAYPFPGADEMPKNHHIFFLLAKAAPDALAQAKALCADGERVALTPHALYLQVSAGLSGSKLAAKLPRLLKTPCTARNCRSAQKIRDLASK